MAKTSDDMGDCLWDILMFGCYDVGMRTTVTIDDDVLAVARALAERNRSSLGSALSELARRGFKSTATREDGDGTTFPVAADAESITSEDVYRSLDDSTYVASKPSTRLLLSRTRRDRPNRLGRNL